MLMSPTEPGPARVTEDSRARKEGGKEEERKETLPRAVCPPCYVPSGVTERVTSIALTDPGFIRIHVSVRLSVCYLS